MSLDQSSGLFRCQLSHTSLGIGGGAASVGGLYIGQLVISSAYITGVQNKFLHCHMVPGLTVIDFKGEKKRQHFPPPIERMAK